MSKAFIFGFMTLILAFPALARADSEAEKYARDVDRHPVLTLAKDLRNAALVGLIPGTWGPVALYSNRQYLASLADCRNAIKGTSQGHFESEQGIQEYQHDCATLFGITLSISMFGAFADHSPKPGTHDGPGKPDSAGPADSVTPSLPPKPEAGAAS